MESIRRKVMRRMNKRLEDARNWSSVLPPLVNKKLVERQDEAQFVDVQCASDNEYEVRDGITFYIVNLETQSCDCCLWELSGIPCKHAMAVITAKRMQGQDFVNGYLTKEAYVRIYNNVIHPIPDQTAWPTIKPRKVLPPLHKRMPGCPKKNRKRGPEKGPKQKRSGGVKCRGCGEFGHNIRTCKAKDWGRGNQTNVGTIKDNLSARKRHFETGSCSASATKRRVQVQLHVGEGLSQNATRNINYNTFGEQASQTVGGSSSQPVTTSA
ncbi:hypothetical protein LWI28_012661 [Acer negundo]|uniref:SWIM-type domain-containing protein n=1 Tax=Acer negundo TaxID=4023 RepID=A0AAD5P1L2_ACENE|nr:hypothetical protein LWI28_012661 [Acer negundo]